MTTSARKKDGVGAAPRSRTTARPVRPRARRFGSEKLPIRIAPEDLELEELSERIRIALQASGVTAVQALRNLSKVRARRFREIHGGRR
jgi:hypothetical protein